MIFGQIAVIGLVSSILVMKVQGQSNCLPLTSCDTGLASCTIGIDCLGSPFTMCGLNGLQENGACQTFPNTNTTYCECNTCIGLVNALLYNCACGVTVPGLACPSGQKLVKCTSIVTGVIQYSCCNSPQFCDS